MLQSSRKNSLASSLKWWEGRESGGARCWATQLLINYHPWAPLANSTSIHTWYTCCFTTSIGPWRKGNRHGSRKGPMPFGNATPNGSFRGDGMVSQWKTMDGSMRSTRSLNEKSQWRGSQIQPKTHWRNMETSSSITSIISTSEFMGQPYQLPRFMSNKLLLMEMMRQLAFLHEQVWQKKSTTSNFPIIVSEYQCKSWANVDTMKEELVRYNFKKMPAADHYDLDHRMHKFFMKEREKPYEHKPLEEEEPFRNVSKEVEMRKIHERMHKDAHDQQHLVEATINKRLSQQKGWRSQESTSRVTQFPPMIKAPVGQYASMRVKNLVDQVVQEVRTPLMSMTWES